MKTEKSIYFPGINGLRFLAALAVIITHIELLKDIFHFDNYWRNPLIYNLGGLGVYFFFVLSGFLITYLLLIEKEKFGKINIKQFYVRRILRIWPLYYLIMFLGFFVLPKIPGIQIHYMQADFTNYYSTNLILYLLILPNLAFSIFTAVPHIGQAWSIGVEEQFYAAWPWIISKSKHIARTLVTIIIGLIIFKIIILTLGLYFGQSAGYLIVKKFVAMSKFECMAIGGIGAYLLFSGNGFLKYIYNTNVLNISLLLIPVLVFFTPEIIQDGIHIVYSFLFLVLILNVSNQSVKLKLEGKIINYLGKISYGIYMYHFMIIPFVLLFIKTYVDYRQAILINLIAYTASIALTVIISALSFELFENRFIKIKAKHSLIKSGIKD
jgi:peptidoglycan/LPS O-acetylase OafA/YrhL